MRAVTLQRNDDAEERLIRTKFMEVQEDRIDIMMMMCFWSPDQEGMTKL